MSKQTPSVSVILPVYNGERYLRAAISSILAQSFADFELLVIDDGSKDQSFEIASAYSAADKRVKISRTDRNEGVVAALNSGLRRAAAEFVARFDQDDVALPNRLKEQIHFLNLHPDVAVLGSGMFLTDASGKVYDQRQFPENDGEIRFAMMLNNAIGDPTVMCRASVIRRAGLWFNEHFTGAEDYAFWTSVMRHGRAYNLPQMLIEYRNHDNQMSAIFSSKQAAAASQISDQLMAAVDPVHSRTWPERKALLWLYRRFMEFYPRSPELARTLVVNINRVMKIDWCELSAERQRLFSLVGRLQSEKALQHLAGSFLRVHPCDEPRLVFLAESV